MGEARKRRLALIKGGHAEVAKTLRPAPERLVELRVLLNPELDAAITERYEKQVTPEAKTKSLPTRAAFVEALLVAGLSSFDKFVERKRVEREGDPLIALATPGQAAEMTKGVTLG